MKNTTKIPTVGMSPITAITAMKPSEVAEEPGRAHDDLAHRQVAGIGGQVHVDAFADLVLGVLARPSKTGRRRACGTSRSTG